MPRNENELWTVEEVAAFLRLKPKTIYNRVSAGTIPCVKVAGAVRFEPSQIRALMKRMPAESGT